MYFIAEWNYTKSVVSLCHSKYYIKQYGNLINGKTATDATNNANPITEKKLKIMNWFHCVCQHRQEQISIVFMLPRLGPMLSRCRNDLLSGACIGITDSLPASGSLRDRSATRLTGLRCHSSVEMSATKLLSTGRERYGRAAILLVQVPNEALTSSDSRAKAKSGKI